MNTLMNLVLEMMEGLSIIFSSYCDEHYVQIRRNEPIDEYNQDEF